MGGDDWVGIISGRSRSKLVGVYVWLDVDLGRDIDGVELCCLCSRASIALAVVQ
jgi:hypothetical protein